MLIIFVVKAETGYSILFPNGMQQFGTKLSDLVREAEEVSDYFTNKGNPCLVMLDDDVFVDMFGDDTVKKTNESDFDDFDIGPQCEEYYGDE